MTPVSLMPPIDYCPSCEGRRAENQAIDVAKSRADQAERNDLKAPSPDASAPSPGAVETAPAGGAVSPLIAPDLAVLAMQAGSETEPAVALPAAGDGAAALRLRMAEAYRGA